MKTRLRVPSYCMQLIYVSVVYYLAALDRRLASCTKIFARSVVDRGLLTLFVYVTFSVPFIAFSDIGAEWNPTGNPIGGGPGYSDSVRYQDADYYVTDKAGLLSALSNASVGDIVYVADYATIDLTSEQDIFIPGGVTLASGRGTVKDDTISWGGLVFTTARDQYGYSLFRAGGKHVRVTGLRFQGEYGNYREYVTPDTFPYSNAKCFDIWQDSIEIDNCEFWGWGHIAVGSYNSSITRFHVHHCFFYNTIMATQGVGCYNYNGSGNLFEANLFDFVRQNIASSGRTTASYEARWNLCLEHGVTHGFDRHGYPAQGDTAGYSTTIHHNTIRNTGWGLNSVRIRGRPVDSAIVYNNWFHYSSQDSSISFYVPQNVAAYDNHYGLLPPQGVFNRIPDAVINTNTTSGTVPLTVSFTGSGSSDPDGIIAWYEWDFGDNSGVVRAASVNHTYDQIGVYMTELTVHDNDGITAFDTLHVTVAPTSTDSHYMSAWVNDRNCDIDTGFFFKQILLDDWIVWESDIAGYHGWEHVLVNVTDSINAWGSDSVTITLRVICKKNMTGQIGIMETWWDDVALFWGDVHNGDFEMAIGQDASFWHYSENETWFWGGIDNGDSRSGNKSFEIMFYVSQYCAAGGYGKVEQKVAINSAGILPSSGDCEVCSLYFPYPNPARIQTQFGYTLDIMSKVSFNIYDVSGRFVRNIIEGTQMPGEYDMMWDGKDYAGKSVTNGVYFLRFSAGDYEETKQIVWLR